jgi:Family of unknown function (DUF5681)
MSQDTSDDTAPPEGYPIGYRKPPRHSQFKKGQSGHPTGRPKGTPNFATALERALGEQVVVNEGGQRRTVSKLVVAVTQLVNKATMGDARATQQLLNVLYVLDDVPSEVHDVSPTTESDNLVMAHLLERLRTTTNEEHADDSQTNEEEHADDPHT